MSAHYRVFYCDYDGDREVAANGAHLADVATILALMDEVLTSAGSFVGVIDAHGNMLQFIVGDDDGISLELPVPQARGHYAKPASLADCKDVLRGMDGVLAHQRVDGLTFERW